MPEYETLRPGTDAVAEVEVKKSRFIGVARRCGTEEAARELVSEARRTHHTARHHCSAWVIGADRRLQRSNDDGEPGGTAGQPILDVINGRGLSDVAIVVTRYFGGTLLGAGGLVRAYGDAAAAALDRSGRVRRQRLDLVGVSVPHDVAGRFESGLRNAGFTVESVAYADLVTFTFATDSAEALHQTAARVAGAPVEPIPLGHTWVDRPV